MKTITQSPAIDIESLVAEAADRFTDEIKQGRAPSIDEYAAQYPDIAPIIRQVFPALAVLDAGPASQAALSASPPPVTGEGLGEGAPAVGLLGDFHILREVGRGGMGVVYEAEQISLGRRVAIKVLPFAAMLDRQQLARFKNEARAAATLDHPNIVAIYSVGCERGVHYYAMQLIEGQSLAETIACMKPGRSPSVTDTIPSDILGDEPPAGDTAKAALPTVRNGSAAFSSIPPFASREYFRTIAELGIQAAEALDHAHQNGILHRDIKPANLLVECSHLAPRDEGLRNPSRGLTLHHAERDAYTHPKLWITDFGLARMEQDAGMTMTGDLLGTLRYMSPEQALAKRVIVDHRSDIYSLGVTLYELLTLQPAFAATDRQELLRQIAFEEPRKPRQINARMPQDLETIILKSIEKNPADRYTTAHELADDLRRFVAKEPIRAKAPGLINRAGKWARRHAALISIAAAALAATTVAGLVAALLVYRAYNSEAKHRLTAQSNLAVAYRSIEQTLRHLAKAQYDKGDLLQAESLAEDATRFYEELAQHNDTPELRYCAAQAYGNLAEIWSLLDRHEKAAEASRHANELLRPLVAAEPANKDYLSSRAWNNVRLGWADFGLQRYDQAEIPFDQALADIEKLIKLFPNEPKHRLDLASALDYRAQVYEHTERLDEAEECYQRIAKIMNSLPEETRNSFLALNNRAAQLSNHAIVARFRGDSQREVELVKQAIVMQRRALELSPNHPSATEHLCRQNINLVQTLIRLERIEEAANTVELLIDASPERLRACHEAASLLLQCADLADRKALAAESISLIVTRAIAPGRPLPFGLVPRYAPAYRQRAREIVAMAHKAPIRTPDSVDVFIRFLLDCEDKSFRDIPRALELAKQAVKEIPNRRDAWVTLAFAHHCNRDTEAADIALDTAEAIGTGDGNARELQLRALVSHQAGRHDEAHQWHDKYITAVAEQWPSLAKLRGDYAEADKLLEELTRDRTSSSDSEPAPVPD
jgi:serine/threonine protein kinase/tetratricopeptide (TPR) repeat protein